MCKTPSRIQFLPTSRTHAHTHTPPLAGKHAGRPSAAEQLIKRLIIRLSGCDSWTGPLPMSDRGHAPSPADSRACTSSALPAPLLRAKPTRWREVCVCVCVCVPCPPPRTHIQHINKIHVNVIINNIIDNQLTKWL